MLLKAIQTGKIPSPVQIQSQTKNQIDEKEKQEMNMILKQKSNDMHFFIKELLQWLDILPEGIRYIGKSPAELNNMLLEDN